MDLELSPKSQEKVRLAPLGSNDPALEKATVSGASPIIDTKKTGTSTNFTQDELARIQEFGVGSVAASHHQRVLPTLPKQQVGAVDPAIAFKG